MGKLLQSEFIQLNTAVESSNGTLPSTGWKQLQVEPNGLSNFYAQIKKEARSPLSSTLMEEKGDVVDLDVSFDVVHDVNKDLSDQYLASWLRSAVKFPGGTGTGRWIASSAYGGPQVTAFGASAITVSVGGSLPQQALVYGRGWATPSNNALFVVGAASTGTSIPISGGTAEASPPNGAMVEVVGFQGAAGDITLSVAGGVTTIESTLLDFTTLGIQPYSWMWVGGGTAAAPGAFGFATAGNRGLCRVLSVAAHAIVVDRTATTWTSDTGTGKTIQIFLGAWVRSVYGSAADYLRTSHSFELVAPGIGSGGVDDYVYAVGSGLDQVEFNAAQAARIKATLKFIGFDVQDPTTVRTTGASSALAPLYVNALNSADQMMRIRVSNTDGTDVLVDIQTWKLTLMHNVKAYKKQGTLGNSDLIYGKVQAALTIDGAIFQDDTWKAVRDNRTVRFEALARNSDCALLFDLPACTVEGAAPKFAANDAARFSPSFKTFRDPNYNYVAGITEFPYLPSS